MEKENLVHHEHVFLGDPPLWAWWSFLSTYYYYFAVCVPGSLKIFFIQQKVKKKSQEDAYLSILEKSLNVRFSQKNFRGCRE